MFQKLNLKFIVIFALIATWSSTSMPVWALSMDDLVMREAIYYEKFSNIPFTGAVDEVNERGVFRGGKKDGQWLLYSSDGQLLSDVTYADGKGLAHIVVSTLMEKLITLGNLTIKVECTVIGFITAGLEI